MTSNAWWQQHELLKTQNLLMR
ncbi:hypothetical protein JMJ77_0014917, partial [Colletotrichum scovillei]